MYTVAQAQTLCDGIPACAGFTYASSDSDPSSPVLVSFKYNAFYAAASGQSSWIKNAGYEPGQQNLWVADLTDFGFEAIDALRVNGGRGILARYPNGEPGACSNAAIHGSPCHGACFLASP